MKLKQKEYPLMDEFTKKQNIKLGIVFAIFVVALLLGIILG